MTSFDRAIRGGRRSEEGGGVIPPSFEYVAPKTIPEAISLLEKFGQNSKILAGGQSLIPVMKLRLASPTHLIDIKETDGFLKIGALTRMSEIESSDLIKKKYFLLHDAAKEIADPTVRNLGT